MAYKVGVNKTDIKAINRLYNEGYKADQIAQMLLIKKEVIAKFLPEKVEESAKKTKARNKKSTEDHKKAMSKKSGNDTPEGKPTE